MSKIGNYLGLNGKEGETQKQSVATITVTMGMLLAFWIRGPHFGLVLLYLLSSTELLRWLRMQTVGSRAIEVIGLRPMAAVFAVSYQPHTTHERHFFRHPFVTHCIYNASTMYIICRVYRPLSINLPIRIAMPLASKQPRRRPRRTW